MVFFKQQVRLWIFYF